MFRSVYLCKEDCLKYCDGFVCEFKKNRYYTIINKQTLCLFKKGFPFGYDAPFIHLSQDRIYSPQDYIYLAEENMDRFYVIALKYNLFDTFVSKGHLVKLSENELMIKDIIE